MLQQLASSIDDAATTLTAKVQSANLAAGEAVDVMKRATRFSLWRICLR
jgi:hypothetical protein